MSTIRVHITNKDIRNGHRGNPHSCPISRAMRRAMRRLYNSPSFDISVSVGPRVAHTRRILKTMQTQYIQWLLSPGAIEWMAKFDRGDEVKPFSFPIHPVA